MSSRSLTTPYVRFAFGRIPVGRLELLWDHLVILTIELFQTVTLLSDLPRSESHFGRGLTGFGTPVVS